MIVLACVASYAIFSSFPKTSINKKNCPKYK